MINSIPTNGWYLPPWMKQAGMQMPQAAAPAPAPPAVPPAVVRPKPEMSAMPTAGWQGPQGGLNLADILDGPQAGAAGAGAGMFPSAPSAMPNPQAPQQNFNQLGKDLMAQIVGGA